MNNFVPPLVLTLVCVAVSGMLAFANALTKPKIEKAQEEKLNSSLVEVFGEGEYKVSENTFENINQVITDDKNRAIFDITVDGYAKEGIQALIGIDENGEVCGISILSIKETAGLGTKVQDSAYIEKYIGLSTTEFSDDTLITGATYSSKAMRNAVSIAMETYSSQKEVIFNE